MSNFRRIPLGLLLVAALAALAWGSDPWKSKPYQQWDKKDVEKILTDSPWAQSTSITASWKSGMTSNPVMRTQGSGSTMGGGAMGGPAGLGMTPHERTVKFVARWTSALTVREALARKAVLDGQLAQAAAGKDLAQATGDYQITIFGDDMTPFLSLEGATIAQGSYIKMNKSKEQVAPSSVQIARSPDGSKVIFVAFHFPKSANGTPTIGPDEKGIEFVCKVKNANLRFRFDPRKMEGVHGRDL